jgi:hypothetical protein
MAQIVQTVTFTQEEIQAILVDKAKEQIKTETSKEPTGSSLFRFAEQDKEKQGAIVTFQCNGKR